MSKTVIFMLSVVFATALAGEIKPLSPEEKTTLITALKECQADPNTGLTKEEADQVKSGNWPENEKVKVAFLCLAKKINFQNANGDLNIDTIKKSWSKHYDAEDMAKLEACIVQKSTPGETAAELFKCKQKHVGLANDLITV